MADLAGIDSLARAHALARAALPPASYDYCAGGAGSEAGVHRNVARLDDRALVPRVLAGSGEVVLATELPGGPAAAPVLVAPMGLQALCHPDAEVATAAAAGGLGLGFVLSMFSSRGVEEVAGGAGPGLRWQQIYLLRDPGLTAHLVGRAEAAGCRAVVVTVDVPVLGARERDARRSFDRFAAAPPAILEDPELQSRLARRRATDPGCSARRLLDSLFPDPGGGWPGFARVVQGTGLPVLAKGLLDPRDARAAVDHGAAGVVVSTHGGRQSDLHPAAVDALGPVVEAVGDRVPVLFDSGVRRGEHVAVALALGARAVLVGRPVLWGLAAGGRDGARRVLELLLSEVRRTMLLAGAVRVADLRDRAVLDYRGWAAPPGAAPPEPGGR